MSRCAYCATVTSGDLCGTCAVGLTSAYYECNSVIVVAYAAHGIAQIEESLARHAEFEAWLLHEDG